MKIWRSAIITVAIGILAFLLDKQWDRIRSQGTALTVIEFSGVYVVLSVALAALENFFERLWNWSPAYRKALDLISGNLVIEGDWVDIGIDTSAGDSRLVSFSYIRISRRSYNYSVEGTSWDLQGANTRTWYSEHAQFDDNRALTFWYTGNVSGEIENNKAVYRFAALHGRAIGFEGKYDDDAFATHGRFYRPGFGDDMDAMKRAAISNLERMKRMEGYDEQGFKTAVNMAADDGRDWYRVFVKRSDKMEAEATVLLSLADGIAKSGQARSVLDIGPAEGRLSGKLVAGLLDRGVLPHDFSYFGLDPSGSRLDFAEKQILAHAPHSRRMFIKGNFQDWSSANAHAQYDLILALNVLYYFPDLGVLLGAMAGHLSATGKLVALYTDIDSESILLDLAEFGDPAVDWHVAKNLEPALKQAGLQTASIAKGTVTLAFPNLNDLQWIAVEKGLTQSDRNVTDTLDLICFIMNLPTDRLRSSGCWRNIVRKIRAQLSVSGDRIQFPVVGRIIAPAGRGAQR